MIRRAQHSDIVAIVDMGERFYATTSYAQWAPFCRSSSAGLVRTIIDTGVLLIAETAGRPVGMVGMFIAPFMFNHELRAAHEVFWWVEPEARGGMTAWRLLQGLETACLEAGCSAIQMMSLPSSPPQAQCMYERAGYALTEKSFTKILRSA